MNCQSILRRPVQMVRRLLPAVLALALSACGGGGGDAPSQEAVQPPSLPIAAYEQQASAEPTVFRSQRRPTREGGHVVRLGPLSALHGSGAAAGAGTPQRIGRTRVVGETDSIAAMAALLDWQVSASGGRIATLRFSSEGAMGLRIGLEVKSLPGVALLRVVSVQDGEAVEVPGREVWATLERNAAAGEFSQDARTFWLPLVAGAQAVLEIELPPGIDPAAVAVSAPRLSHLDLLPRDADATVLKAIGDSERCQVDVACSPDHARESNSVARLVYNRPDGTYVCSGTLMADRSASGTPYFLSAQHCIDSQSVASTLSTYWFFRASSCNSGTLSAQAVARHGGATLLYTSVSTDTSFMRLNSAPPPGAIFAASGYAAAPVNSALTTLHHPAGDLQKISVGTLGTYANCSAQGCGAATAGNYLQVRWTRGSTEGGSSGSPAFFTFGGNRYVVGQLSRGNASCSVTNGSDFYGRLDLAYSAGINRWLDAPESSGRNAVYRFYNAVARAHFYTSSAAERDFLMANDARLRYEGISYYAYAAGAQNLAPVYRLYNATTGTHFYTTSAGERDYASTNPRFIYEMESWWVAPGEVNGARPVYRFYRPAVGAHFYTISEGEKESVRAAADWVFEGVAYHAWTQ
ncbi:MAG: serine protease [Comamonadaceae bacterium]|nr:MAG: serine protease [Comamonadaceae bacterium]